VDHSRERGRRSVSWPRSALFFKCRDCGIAPGLMKKCGFMFAVVMIREHTAHPVHPCWKDHHRVVFPMKDKAETEWTLAMCSGARRSKRSASSINKFQIDAEDPGILLLATSKAGQVCISRVRSRLWLVPHSFQRHS
jgi:hypothetical protein